MTRPHVLAVTAVLGAAAIAGVLAVTQTVALGQSASSPSTTELAQREAAIDAAAARAAALNADVPPAVRTPEFVPGVASPEVRTILVRSSRPTADDGHGWDADDDEHGVSGGSEEDEHEGWDDEHEGWDDEHEGWDD